MIAFIFVQCGGLKSKGYLIQVITYGRLESNVEGGVLQSLQETLSKVYLPLMKSYKDWGDLDQIPGGDKMKKHFVENVEQFVQTLRSK